MLRLTENNGESYGLTGLWDRISIWTPHRICALRLRHGLFGWGLGLEAGIWVSRLDLGLKVEILASMLGFGPLCGYLGLDAGSWASRLGF